MIQNRFEQVDAPAEDALTLSLSRAGEKLFGVLTCAASATGGRLPRDFTSDEMPLKDAVSSAVRLANELKVALVVQDPDGLWQADWGTLYRYDGDDADGP